MSVSARSTRCNSTGRALASKQRTANPARTYQRVCGAPKPALGSAAAPPEDGVMPLKMAATCSVVAACGGCPFYEFSEADERAKKVAAVRASLTRALGESPRIGWVQG